MKVAVAGWWMLAVAALSGSAGAVPRVVVENGALLCWEAGKVTSRVDTFSVGTQLEAEASMWPEGRVVPVKALVPVPPELEPVPPGPIQLSTRRGRVNVEACNVEWEDAGSVEPEGKEHPFTVLPPASEPYRSTIRQGLGAKSVQVEHLVRLDLDGDGVSEVLFSGFYRSASSAAFRAWYTNSGEPAPRLSVTHFVGLLHAPRGRGQRLRILSRREASPATYGMPGTYIAGVTDVTGDGSLELVVALRGDHWEGHDFVRLEGSAIHSIVTTDLYW